MIRKKTVLILGAGASLPYGFPTGRELVFDVVEDLNQSGSHLKQVLIAAGFLQVQISSFREHLLRSGLPSIDLFLENRPEHLELGRAAIAYKLIVCENPAGLVRSRRMRWYEYLFDRLGTKLDEVRLSRLSVITFNYDRSFEYSFFSRLGNAFGLDEDDAVQVLREIPIVHVHGQLGLPHFLDSGGREYNTVTSAETVKLAAKGIKIVHELEGESEEFVMAHELISNAERLAFLGFGYHQENVRRLRLRLFSGNEMVGTAYGLTYAEQEDVAKFDGMEGMTFANEETKILKFLRSSRVLR